MELDVSLVVEPPWDVDEAWATRVVRATVESEPSPQGRPNVGVVIAGQERVRDLNRTFLGHATDTDVIAFPLDVAGDGFVRPADGSVHLGEVVVSYPQAEVQAAEHGHSVRRELALLIAHGALHLLGYDDLDPVREPEMRRREAEVLARLGEDAR